MQRTSDLHVAIIMDGNGRWATRQHLPRAAGHRAGAESVRRAVETARANGIGALSLFAFSADNWQRPRTEVRSLMSLFAHYLRFETTRLIESDVRLEIIGRRDRLSKILMASVDHAESATAHCSSLHMRLAIDYSARAAIESQTFIPDVDLLIRTGGEQRLSDFLLWECAYAELYFTPVMWPDFRAQDLIGALNAFRARERRFGALPPAAPRLTPVIAARQGH